MAVLVENDADLWELCKELQELGGGIRTRLEPTISLNLTRCEELLEGPPYELHESGMHRPVKTEDLTNFALKASGYVQQGFNSTLLVGGPSGSGKSTFLFNTQFLEVLIDNALTDCD